MVNRIKSAVRRRLLEIQSHQGGEKYYHGSVYPKLEWSAAPEDTGERVGWNGEGYGLYITPDYDQARGYAFKNETDGYVYELLVNDLNILHWGEKVPEDVVNKVKSIPDFYDLFNVTTDFSDLRMEDYEYEIGDYFSWQWDILPESKPLPQWAIAGGGTAGYFLYNITTEIGAHKGVESPIKYGLTHSQIIETIKAGRNTGTKETINVEDFVSADVARNFVVDTISISDLINPTLKTLYWYMYLKMGSMKKVTYFFRKLGYDAFYIDNRNDQDHFLNLINPTKIIEIKREKVTYDPTINFADY